MDPLWTLSVRMWIRYGVRRGGASQLTTPAGEQPRLVRRRAPRPVGRRAGRRRGSSGRRSCPPRRDLVVRAGVPRTGSATPYWSDQKYGELGGGALVEPAGEQRGRRRSRAAPARRSSARRDGSRPWRGRTRPRSHRRRRRSGSPVCAVGVRRARRCRAARPLPCSHSMFGIAADADHHDVGGQVATVDEIDTRDPVSAAGAFAAPDARPVRPATPTPQISVVPLRACAPRPPRRPAAQPELDRQRRRGRLDDRDVQSRACEPSTRPPRR